MTTERINVLEVQKATKALDEAYNAKLQADKNLGLIRGLGGQQGYKITVAGVSVTVADMDPRYYTSKLVRGREMIHLGALKALQGIVDYWESEVATREARLAALARVVAP